jgi:hypothetical protein
MKRVSGDFLPFLEIFCRFWRFFAVSANPGSTVFLKVAAQIKKIG